MVVDRLVVALRAWIPDPLAVAIGLTIAAFALAWGLGTASAGQLIDAWADPKMGLWSLLAFSMQMCLILVTGHAVAETRPFRAAMRAVAGLPRDTGQAAALVSIGAMALALLNWGLGLIGGALLAREVGYALRDRGVPVHYPLLGAAGYTGLAVWHGGLSGSAPLKVSQMKDLTEVLGADLAQQIGVIPIERTLFHGSNLVASGAMLVVVPLVLMALVPKDPASFVPPPPRPAEPPAPEPSPGFAGFIEEGPWLTLPLAAAMAWWTWRWAATGGVASLDPNEVTLVFWMIGLALAGSPAAYSRVIAEAARGVAGILVQFPLYGGIVALLTVSGLMADLAEVLPRDGSLPFATFATAAALNLLVPSGGGQWSVQGPIVMRAAVDAGVDPARVVMALAYGDQWTNLLQPFWALPLLGITGGRASDLLGYTALVMLATGPVFALVTLWA